MFIARRAGMYEATRPTAASNNATEMSVTGSDGETPTSRRYDSASGNKRQDQAGDQSCAYQHKSLAQHHL